MSKKISPTLIGGFVSALCALLVIAVIAFGSGRLFRQTKEFVALLRRQRKRPPYRRAGEV